MTVQSVERVFDILEQLSRHPKGISLTDIGRQLDLHKSTVHRLLAVLRQRGYVEKDDITSMYRLGVGFVGLASSFLNSLELKTEAEPHLRHLSKLVNQTVYLATLQGREAVYLDKFEQFDSLRKYSIIGQRRPLYCTSLGKALLMGKSDDEVRELLRDVAFERLTPKTMTDIASLLKNLEECRRRGWTADDEEIEPGIKCLGAPIYDYRGTVVAALSVSWAAMNDSVTFDNICGHVTGAAREISKHLGFTGKD